MREFGTGLHLLWTEEIEIHFLPRPRQEVNQHGNWPDDLQEVLPIWRRLPLQPTDTSGGDEELSSMLGWLLEKKTSDLKGLIEDDRASVVEVVKEWRCVAKSLQCRNDSCFLSLTVYKWRGDRLWLNEEENELEELRDSSKLLVN